MPPGLCCLTAINALSQNKAIYNNDTRVDGDVSVRGPSVLLPRAPSANDKLGLDVCTQYKILVDGQFHGRVRGCETCEAETDDDNEKSFATGNFSLLLTLGVGPVQTNTRGGRDVRNVRLLARTGCHPLPMYAFSHVLDDQVQEISSNCGGAFRVSKEWTRPCCRCVAGIPDDCCLCPMNLYIHVEFIDAVTGMLSIYPQTGSICYCNMTVSTLCTTRPWYDAYEALGKQPQPLESRYVSEFTQSLCKRTLFDPDADGPDKKKAKKKLESESAVEEAKEDAEKDSDSSV